MRTAPAEEIKTKNAGKTCVLEFIRTCELGDPFGSDALCKPVRYLEKCKDYVR